MDNYKIVNADCLEYLDSLEENSIDCIITDPPYELGFMNKKWDQKRISFDPETWRKCLRVLKPGGYLLSFGGTRTYHRMTCAIEDAGFEVRDCMFWLYGQGYPKSMNISKGIEAKERYGKANTRVKRLVEQSCEGEAYTQKQPNNGVMGEVKDFTRKKYAPTSELAQQWDGWGTCLKPSAEPIVIARKPFKGSLIDNIMEYGVGGLNIDACRVPTGDIVTTHKKTSQAALSKGVYGDYGGMETHQAKGQELGRFPANVLHDGSEEATAGMPITAPTKPHKGDGKTLDTRGQGWGFKRMPSLLEDNGGSASRYYYCAKASRKDRDEGLEGHNIHTTVKPTELMQYLVRLVAPEGATILDPFMGSGSTGKAAAYENKERNMNYKFIGVEKEADYHEIAQKRIRAAVEDSE